MDRSHERSASAWGGVSFHPLPNSFPLGQPLTRTPAPYRDTGPDGRLNGPVYTFQSSSHVKIRVQPRFTRRTALLNKVLSQSHARKLQMNVSEGNYSGKKKKKETHTHTRSLCMLLRDGKLYQCQTCRVKIIQLISSWESEILFRLEWDLVLAWVIV